MYLGSRNWIYSPSDLCYFMESPYASWMDRYVKICPESKKPTKDADDALNQTLQKKGYTHEETLIEVLELEGKTVFTIPSSLSNDEKQSHTIDAMARGEEVIFQAMLSMDPFQGHADFLIKVPGESCFGDYHYEVWDTKLSRQVKAKFLLQLCCYAEMLEHVQGRRPESMTVVLGNMYREAFRVDDYFFYYQSVKKAFLKAQASFDESNVPDPADYSDWGHWSEYAKTILLERDHLFQVASISKRQLAKFNAAGIFTLEQLANSTIVSIPGLDNAIYQRLIAQAGIQLATRNSSSEKPCFEILVPEAGKQQGLAILPPHSDMDVFFDIEGFPLDDGGLEYLWGNTYLEADGTKAFKDFWAHDRAQEKQCFQYFIHWVYARWQQDPHMHVYHYANYEIAAIRKLMGRYGVCEHEVDELLRNEVFVDLYKVVKGGVLLGEPRYSIKNVEHLYRGKRETEVGNGSDSVVVYENWRELNAQGKEGNTWQTSKILNDIRDYNIDDCDSTYELVLWLREQQAKYQIAYVGKTDVVEVDQQKLEDITATTQLRNRLLVKAEKEGLETLQGKLTEHLAWSLEFHRREAKPVFWKLFDRLGQSEDELFDDLDCLAMCKRTEREPFAIKRSKGYEYRFNSDQAFKGATNSFYVLGEQTEDGKRLKASYVPEESDLQNGLVVFKSTQDNLPACMTIVPDEHVSADAIAKALEEVVRQYEGNKLSQCAILDFLKRSHPRIKGRAQGKCAGPIITDLSQTLVQLIDAVLNLDGSYLTIQGPPGAGKTYSGKHVIAELIKRGLKVGISSNSHKAINNLLLATAEYCADQNIEGHFFCAKDTDPELTEQGVTIMKSGSEVPKKVQPACVIGTTAWGFSRDDMVGELDYLFIDEAGQVSVANLIAMSRSTKNIVIMGDQMQLGQPTQGTHPSETGLSILDYLLKGMPTIPDNMGVFLGTTYRMHSKVNDFISGAVYEGKLHSHPANDQQVIFLSEQATEIDREAGIAFLPVEHSGNTQSSEEEIEKIVEVTRQLLTCMYQNKAGEVKPVSFEQILYVAPYNHQVTLLRQALVSLPGGENAKVGSVDKFQGQESPIVFYSLCASDPSETPRGMEFIYDVHRLNVAISRAQSLAIVVGNPTLKSVAASKPSQMKLINMMARLLDDDHLVKGKSSNLVNSDDSLGWTEAIKQASEAVNDWMQQAKDSGLPIPEVFFELANDKGVVVAEGELAWPQAKVVLLTEEQSSFKSEFERAGWEIITLHYPIMDVINLPHMYTE